MGWTERFVFTLLNKVSYFYLFSLWSYVVRHLPDMSWLHDHSLI